MPHPLLSMKFCETFRNSKFDPYIYFCEIIKGLRVGSYFWATLYIHSIGPLLSTPNLHVVWPGWH